MKLALIAAVGRNLVIGRDGQMPWHIGADLKRFKRLTLGCPVIMGRRTFESIGRPLPKRRNLVLSRRGFTAPGVEVVDSLAAALALARADAPRAVCVIGGSAVYADAWPLATDLHLTVVHRAFAGDAFFPAWPAPAQWVCVGESAGCTDTLPYSFRDYVRRR